MDTKLREPVNGLTHLGGAIAALIGMIALIVIARGQPVKVVSVLVYSISLIAMFSASATYHMANVKPVILQTLRKIDHSAIFLLIAGTYAPFCLLAFTGFWHWGLLTLIWVIAVSGVVVSVFYIKSPRWLHTGIYVVMGWLCLMAAPQMPAVLTVTTMIWLFLGGVIYTLGAVVYATKILDFVPGKFGFHEIWHIFVLLGTLAHFIAVITLLVMPV
jgi:hemolysin III